MTISSSSTMIDQELDLDELQCMTGGILPLIPMTPLVKGVVVGVVAGVAGYLVSKKLNGAVDQAPQNLDSCSDGENCDYSGSNNLSYSETSKKAVDPFGGAFTGKQ